MSSLSLLREWIRAALLEAAEDGFYPYEIERGVDIHGYWYRSPGRKMGEDGDPSRPADPYEYIGLKHTDGEASEDVGSNDSVQEDVPELDYNHGEQTHVFVGQG